MSSYFSQSVSKLAGITQKQAQVLQKELGLNTYADLVSFFPYRYEDRTTIHKLINLTQGQDYALLKGRLISKTLHGQDKKQVLTAILDDGSAKIKLVWFKAIDYHQQKLITGTEYLVYGKINEDKYGLSLHHPDYKPFAQVVPEDFGLFPVYNGTAATEAAKITPLKMRQWIRTILTQGRDRIVETLPQEIIAAHSLLSRREALHDIHFAPDSRRLALALRRLKFEELFYFQIQVMQPLKNPVARQPAAVLSGFDLARSFLTQVLPFRLTAAQNRVLKEIAADLGSGLQMNRLLQGDVGSGKTLVAFLAMLMVVGSGMQAVMMAPTEILAFQHYASLSQWAEQLGVKMALLTGSTKTARRREILTGLETGQIQILIGTHALIEDWVQFKALGICVIDEQHRFGVEQRARLRHKNSALAPHILVMTATPIPRTLALTAYGDLAVSVIDQLPEGRKPVKTLHFTELSRLKFFQAMREQLAQGRQVYVVYPAIEENEELAINDLYSGYESIKRAFPEYQVGIVHGKMKSKDRDYEMSRFKNGQSQILCATTVIEVGVNVPNATVMVIENAERFGLAQLHQLRGRVGRGSHQSYCYLITTHKLTREMRERIRILCQTNNGFEIADADLKMRGPGDLKGTQQSGLVGLQLTDLAKDQALIEEVRNCVSDLLSKDPTLELPQHQVVKKKLEIIRQKKGDFSQVG